MKKTLLFLISALSLVSLGACSQGENTSSGQPLPPPDYPIVEFDKIEDPEAIECTVYYFASASFATRDQALATGVVALGAKLPTPKYNPANKDTSFNKFIGWSAKLIAMNDDDLWDFDNDVLPDYVPNLEFSIYGQWDYVE